MIEISKIPKQIVLFFETNFSLAKITIEMCIEALSNSVLSLSREGNISLSEKVLYENVKDLVRVFGDLAKLVPTPYQLTKQLFRLR